MPSPSASAFRTPVLTSRWGEMCVCWVLLSTQSIRLILSPDCAKPGGRSCWRNGKPGIDFPWRNSQFNKKQHAKAQRMQDASEDKQSVWRLQWPESTVFREGRYHGRLHRGGDI